MNLFPEKEPKKIRQEISVVVEKVKELAIG